MSKSKGESEKLIREISTRISRALWAGYTLVLVYVNLVSSAFHLPDERPWEQGWVFLVSSVLLISPDSYFCVFWLCGLVALNFLQAIQPGRSRTDTSRFKRGRKL